VLSVNLWLCGVRIDHRPGFEYVGAVENPPAGPAKAGEAPRQSVALSGVDVSLIRWLLSLTPAQRLAVLQGAARSLAKLRDARTGRGF
jgi:hypothetical protein